MRLLALFSILVLCAAPAFAAEELKVAAQVDKNEVPAGEPLIFSVTIAGPIRQTPKVQLTAFEGFQVVSTGQSQSLQIRSGEVHSALILTYTLAPTAPGTHVLGPVKIEYQGKEYQTQPIEVKVVPGTPEKRSERKQEEQSLPEKEPELEGGVIL